MDQNDVSLGAVTNDDENGEVALFNVIQLKRRGQKSWSTL